MMRRLILLPLFPLFLLIDFFYALVDWTLDWPNRHRPHEWSEPITIGGQTYKRGDITFNVMKRTLKICKRCQITDALECVKPWCRSEKKAA